MRKYFISEAKKYRRLESLVIIYAYEIKSLKYKSRKVEKSVSSNHRSFSAPPKYLIVIIASVENNDYLCTR